MVRGIECRMFAGGASDEGVLCCLGSIGLGGTSGREVDGGREPAAEFKCAADLCLRTLDCEG